MYRLRFLWLMLTSLFNKPKNLDQVFKLRIIVLPFIDTDFKRMFTHTYGSFMSLARWQCLFNSELRNTAIKSKWFPVTVAETIDYKRSIKWFSRVVVETRILCWNENRFYVEHQFKVNDEVYTHAYVEGLVRSPSGIKRPSEIFQVAGLNKPSPPFPPAITTWIQSLHADNRG